MERQGGWSSGGPASGSCPPETIWYSIAGGTAPDVEAQRWLKHAAHCNPCADLLRDAVADLNADIQPHEDAVIERLASSRPAWPHDLARQLALESQPIEPSMRRWWDWRLVLAVASAACLVLVAFFAGNRIRSNRLGASSSKFAIQATPDRDAARHVEALLADAYQASRNTRYRMPGAQHTELRILRSASGHTEMSPDQADAFAIAKRRATSQSSQWLDLLGRSQVLGPNGPDDAIPTLEEAYNLNPHDPAVLRDLALANAVAAERASKNDPSRAKHLTAAYKYSNEALAANPSDPVALFNQALLEMELNDFKAAVTTWQKYLTLDPNSGWAAEARQYLEDAQKKVRQSRQTPDTSPRSFLRNGGDSEIYIEAAVRSWLPLAGGDSYRLALARLSSDLIRQHQDRWLQAVVDGSYDAEGFKALGAAADDNAQGDYSGAVQESNLAIQHFQSLSASAALLRAEFEKVYAERRMLHGTQCSPQAQQLLAGARGRHFPYLEAQAWLESAGCEDFRGNFGISIQDTERAIALSERAGLRFERLRALGFKASFETVHGNPTEAWVLCLQGLQDYWNAWAPPMRGYHFFSEMEFSAEDDGQWALAAILQDAALALLESDEDPDLKAIAHFRRARLAVATGDAATLKRESDAAAFLFASERTRDKGTADIHDAESRVGLADTQLRRGSIKAAQQNLDYASRELASDTDVPYYLMVRLQGTRGDVEKALGNYATAETGYKAGVAAAETALSSLSKVEQLYWSAATEHLYRELASLLIRRGDDNDAWNWWQEHCKASLRHSTSSYSSPPAFSEVALRSSTYVAQLRLTYLLVDDGLAIWSSSEGRRRFRYQALKPGELQRDAQQFMELCRNPGGDPEQLRQISQKLYRVLLTPVDDELQSSPIVLVQPDGALGDFPFEALQDNNGRPFAQIHTVLYSPGLAYDRDVPTSGLSRYSSLLLIGDAASSGRLLPGSEDEIQAFSNVFRHVSVQNGGQLTRDILVRSLSNAAVLEFIGHGRDSFTGAGLLIRSDRNDDSGLLLDTGMLNSVNLSGMKLAVLSACSTARGQRGLLDSESLVQGFLRSGAGMVVASRWDVDSATTARLMTAFYQNIAQGNNVPDALARASQLVRTEVSNQPFYWAAFSVYE